MAQEQAARAGKAVGTRDRVVAWLAAHGDIHDPSGMASSNLARQIGYPGTSIAFAQLLSGMERSGLIEREVRGKRTYQVALTDAGRRRARSRADAPERRRAASAGAGVPARSALSSPDRRQPSLEEVSGALDYDELARQLLVQLAHRLAPSPSSIRPGSEQPVAQGSVLDDLDARLSVLELELVRAKANRTALEEENAVLRAQLERIRRNLEGSEPRRARAKRAVATDPTDHRNIALVQRVLSDSGQPSRRRSSGASAGST
jgi:DNA-binding MarR family transcriptional regulator